MPGSTTKERREVIMKETLEKDRLMKLKAKTKPNSKKAQYLLNDCMICSNHAVNRVSAVLCCPALPSSREAEGGMCHH